MAEAVEMHILVRVEVCIEQVVFQQNGHYVQGMLLTRTRSFNKVTQWLRTTTDQDFANRLEDIAT